jgi:hypothetical protein
MRCQEVPFGNPILQKMVVFSYDPFPILHNDLISLIFFAAVNVRFVQLRRRGQQTLKLALGHQSCASNFC